MADIPEEAVQAAVVAGDHLVNDEWVRDMLAAALPHMPRPTLLLSDDDLDPPKKMLLDRIRELEDAIRQHRNEVTEILNGGAMNADRRLWSTLDNDTTKQKESR